MKTRGPKNISVMVLLCILALATGAAAQGRDVPKGLTESILKEVVSVEALPEGDYTEALALEAESTDYSHATGHAIADAQASGGQAWACAADVDGPGFLLYGPYAEMQAGDYVAFFRIKPTGEANDYKLGHVDACTLEGAKVLAARDIVAGDLPAGRYVQVPLAFHHTGGKLECRLFWSGDASLQVDKVTVVALAGGDLDATAAVRKVPAPVASGLPKDLAYRPRPSVELFPKSKTPASNLLVFDLTRQPRDWQFLLYTLQGVVNRTQPRIYYITNDVDKQWLEWMRKRGWVKSIETLTKPEELVSRFRGSLKGTIIPDPALPATKNVATMIAGLENGVVASPRLAKKLSLSVISDLRGKWKTSVEAYRWALDSLWPRMNHDVLACLWPDNVEVRDYLVENKIFIFWIPGEIDGAYSYSTPNEEIRLVEELLSRTPANTPIMGYSYAGPFVGIGEGGGVSLFSEFAKFLVGSVASSNLSVHSGIHVDKFRQPIGPAPKLDKDKVYVCFAISDGDNLPVVSTGNWPQLWADKTRGEFPIGWTISPSACVLIPDIVDYYYSTATPNDTFMAAVSGVGYCYPDSYAVRFRASDHERVFDGFLGLTDTYMRKMDLRAVCPSLGGSTIQRYAERIPSAQAIFPDYGRTVTTYEDATFATARGIPVFRAATTWDQSASPDERIIGLAAQIRQMAASNRPAFLHVFICNWFWDLPAMKEVLKQLGPDYVAVGPDQLAALCRQDLELKQVQIRRLPGVACFEGQKVRLAAGIRNTSSRAMDVTVTAASGLDQAIVEPSRTRLKPGEAFTAAVSGIPTGDSIRLNVIGPFGLRKCASTVWRMRSDELASPIPDEARLSFVAMYEAESLNHQSGKVAEDPNASGKAAWSASDNSGPSFIVYGPYAGLKPGRYLAIFRMRRSGPVGPREGSGIAATLDTCVGGSVLVTSSRDIRMDELPAGKYREFPIEFDHPGGSVETRVLWTGNVPIAVDYVALWQVKP